MGRNFQRRDDHSGRDRSSSPSLRNPGTEHPELPHGASQKESGRQLGVGGSQLTVMMLIATTKTRRPLSCGKSRAVESEENQKQAFLPSHRPWKSRKTRGIPTFPTAPTAAGISQTRSGILIVVDRKECLTPDSSLQVVLPLRHLALERASRFQSPHAGEEHRPNACPCREDRPSVDERIAAI